MVRTIGVFALAAFLVPVSAALADPTDVEVTVDCDAVTGAASVVIASDDDLASISYVVRGAVTTIEFGMPPWLGDYQIDFESGLFEGVALWVGPMDEANEDPFLVLYTGTTGVDDWEAGDLVLGPDTVACGGAGADAVSHIDGGVFHGGGGSDHVACGLSAGGLFFGGDGNDSMGCGVGEGSAFYGGAGNDRADDHLGGAFYGGPGDDSCTCGLSARGLFVGGAGDDSILEVGGVFRGGQGNDTVAGRILLGAEFHGGGGNDRVGSVSGVFNGGNGDDGAATVGSGGVFSGGNGVDSVDHLNGGVFSGGSHPDFVVVMTGGTFDGGNHIDRVETYVSGVCKAVEIGC